MAGLLNGYESSGDEVTDPIPNVPSKVVSAAPDVSIEVRS